MSSISAADMKEENKGKRPKGYRTGGEQGTAAVDNGDGPEVEFTLSGITFPSSQVLLDDPNVWIGDTAATVHMTSHKQGFINLHEATEDDTVTMGNKQVEEATWIGDLPGTICDKHGNSVGRSVLKEVQLVPTSGYNLFSLTKMMLQGWELIGKNNMLMITKDGHTVKFDIAIRRRLLHVHGSGRLSDCQIATVCM
jgi:hypothetical protein